MVKETAYPLKARPDMQKGVTFFNRMRDLLQPDFIPVKLG